MSDTRAETTNGEERDRQYAWDYFTLHSGQRLTTFNYYVTISIAILAGVSTVIQPDIHLPAIALVLGLVLILISFVFWKLDRRNKILIGVAEAALKDVEKRIELQEGKDLLPASLFRNDEKNVIHRRAHPSIWFWQNHFSYTDSFNLVFIIFGLAGFASMLVGSLMLLPLANR